MKIQGPDADYEKELTRSHRQAVANREKHLQQVDSDLKSEVSKLKEQNETRSNEINDAHRKEIYKAQLEKEAQLQDIDKNFKETAEEINHRLELLKNQNEKKTEDINTAYKARFQKDYEQNVRNMDYQAQIAREQGVKLEEQTKIDLDKNRYRAQDALSAQSVDNERRLTNESVRNRIEMNTLNIGHSKEMSEAQAQFLKEKEFQQKLQARQLDKIQNEFNAQKNLEIGTQNSVLRTSREDFERKFSEMLNFQGERLADMENRYQQELNMIQSKFNTQKEFIANRSQDPFYQTQNLEGQIEDTPNHYIVKVPLPEHEAENIQVGGNKREIKLTFNRRFQGQNDIPEEGQSYVSKNYQSIIKTMTVPDIIDPNSVTRKYEDGVVKFIIKKA